MSVWESGQELLAVVPGLVTRGKPGLRSGAPLHIVERLLVPDLREGVSQGQPNPNSHQSLTQSEIDLLDYGQGHRQVRKKCPDVLWEP